MAGAQQGGGQQPDNSMGMVWIIALVFVLLFGLWYFYHTQIVTVILKIKLFEVAIVSLFTSGLASVQHSIQQADPSQVTIPQLIDLSAVIGRYYQIPAVLLLLVLALILFKSNAKRRYRTIFSMTKLHNQEVKNWGQTTPVLNLGLEKIHIDEGDWAMAMSPMQFAKKFKLLREEERMPKPGEIIRTKQIIAKVIKSRAHQVFRRQLGRPWKGPEHLKPHVRALLAVFAAKAMGDRITADNLLTQISTSSQSGTFNFSGADELLQKHFNEKVVQKAVQMHAYEYTVMASMLELARTDGVLASASFLWLKPYDRELWFVLNTVGRRVAPVEVGGPIAHWIAEKKFGRPLVVPMIDEATVGLEMAIDELIYKRDED